MRDLMETHCQGKLGKESDDGVAGNRISRKGQYGGKNWEQREARSQVKRRAMKYGSRTEEECRFEQRKKN